METISLDEVLNHAFDLRDQRQLREAYDRFGEILEKDPDRTIATINHELLASEIFVEEALRVGRPLSPRGITPLLSIGVPVYNRHPEIRQLICELCYQIAALPEFVEVYIHDNSRNPNNRDLLRQLTPIFPFLKYKRHHSNVGADMNVISLYLEGDSEYQWIIGDDDLLMPGSIAYVIDVIRKYRDEGVHNIYLNPLNVDLPIRALKSRRLHNPSSEDELFILSDGKSIHEIGFEYLRASSQVVKRKALSVPAQRFALGYFISPLAITLNAAREGKTCYVNRPIMAYRDGDKSDWESYALEVYYQSAPRLFANLASSGEIDKESLDILAIKTPQIFAGWQDKVDSVMQARAIEGHSRVPLLESVLDTLLSNPERGVSINLLSDRNAFRPEAYNLPERHYFKIDNETLFMNPTWEKADIKCRFHRIPVLRGNVRLCSNLTLRAEATHAVDFLIRWNEAGGERCLKEWRYRVEPGASLDIEADFGFEALYADLEFSVVMAAGAQNHYHAWCTFRRIVLSVFPSKVVAEPGRADDVEASISSLTDLSSSRPAGQENAKNFAIQTHHKTFLAAKDGNIIQISDSPKESEVTVLTQVDLPHERLDGQIRLIEGMIKDGQLQGYSLSIDRSKKKFSLSKEGKFLCADFDKTTVANNRTSVGPWEIFELVDWRAH